MSKRTLFNVDLSLILPVVVLVCLSLATLFSVNFNFFRSQLLFFAIGLLMFLFFSQVNLRFIERYGQIIYFVSVIILVLVLIIGTESRGAIRWFDILGVRVQFSEILKPFLAISLASFLANRGRSWKTFFLVICFLLPIAFLIFAQPDLGGALVYIFSVVLSLAVFGFSFKLFLAFFSLVILFLPIIWRFLHEYQKQRILTFLNPSDPLGLSYNAIQAIIAVGSGGLFGRGLGVGSQSNLRFLPERHTDFIFASISESLGFLGGAITLFCFGFLLYRIFSIALDSDDIFSKLFCVIVFCFISFQFFINIGMNIGILPIVGVTLPFVSYGGSSLVSSFIILGIVSSISKNSTNRKFLEIK